MHTKKIKKFNYIHLVEKYHKTCIYIYLKTVNKNIYHLYNENNYKGFTY